MITDEGALLRRVAVCSPREAYFQVTELAAHNLTARAERGLALGQHRALREALATLGAEVVNLPEIPTSPNCIFVQDPAVMTLEGFIRLRMGLLARHDEPDWIAAALMALGYPEVGKIQLPGTVEGGDLILAGGVAFVGCSSRTNDQGVRQISMLLERMGYEVRVALVREPSLHIGGMMSVVGPRQVLACTTAFPPYFFAGFEVFPIPQATFISGNVITLGGGTVLVERCNLAAIEVLASAGFSVQVLNLSEFVKGSGGPSCLILPLDRV